MQAAKRSICFADCLVDGIGKMSEANSDIETEFKYTLTKGEFRYRGIQWNNYTTQELLLRSET